MTFLNPLMLWGALGALVPVLLHLWGRGRPRQVPFPSLRLIRISHQRRSGMGQLHEWLVLLLRVLLILVISLALSGPRTDWAPLAAVFPGQERTVVVVDRSASMAQRRGPLTSLQRARAAAQTIAEAGRRAHPPVVFTADTKLHRLPRGLADLRLVQPSPVRGDLLRAMERCTDPDLWDPASRVFVITDLQETSLRGQLSHALPRPPVVVDVGQPGLANRGIMSAKVRSSCPLARRPLDLEVCAARWGQNRGTAPLEIAVQLNGRSLPGATVPPGRGQHQASLRLTPDQGGDAVITLAISPDSYPFDDSYHLIVNVRRNLRVTVVSGRSNPRFFSLALNPGAEAETGIEVRRAQWTDAPASVLSGDLLVATDVPPGQGARRVLEACARTAHPLLLFTGPDTALPADLLQRLLGAPVRLVGIREAPYGEPLRIAQVNVDRPPLDVFASDRAGNLSSFRFTHRAVLEGQDEARVLARFSDGGAAVLGTLDPKRTFILVNTSLDDRWTDAPFHPSYVPFVHRLCYDVIGPLPCLWPDWVAGEPMGVTRPRGARGVPRVVAPDGAEVRVKSRGTQWMLTPPSTGVYTATWREGEQTRSVRFAVNVHPAESDPTRISPDRLKEALRSPSARIIPAGELAAALHSVPPGQADLTCPLLLMALLLLAAETFFTAPQPRSRRRQGDLP